MAADGAEVIELDPINLYAVSRAPNVPRRKMSTYAAERAGFDRVFALDPLEIKPKCSLYVVESVSAHVLGLYAAAVRRAFVREERLDEFCAYWERDGDEFRLVCTQQFVNEFEDMFGASFQDPVFYSLYRRDVANDGLFLERTNVPVITLVEATPTDPNVVGFSEAWQHYWQFTDNEKPENTFFVLSFLNSPGPVDAHAILAMTWDVANEALATPEEPAPIEWAIIADDDIMGCRTLRGVIDEDTGGFVKVAEPGNTVATDRHSALFLTQQLCAIKDDIEADQALYKSEKPLIYAPRRPGDGKNVKDADGETPFAAGMRADGFLLISRKSAITRIPFTSHALLAAPANQRALLDGVISNQQQIDWCEPGVRRRARYVFRQSEDYALHMFTGHMNGGYGRTWQTKGMFLRKAQAAGGTPNMPCPAGFSKRKTIVRDRLTALTFDPASLLPAPPPPAAPAPVVADAADG